MKLTSLPFLLILLVLATPLDDALALATPDTTDDLQAAENNTYLLSVPQEELKSVTDQDLRSGQNAAIDVFLSVAPPLRAGEAVPPASPVSSRQLLYLLLCLRW